MRAGQLVSASFATALIASCSSSLVFTAAMASRAVARDLEGAVAVADFVGLALGAIIVSFLVMLLALLALATPLTLAMKRFAPAVRGAILVAVGTGAGCLLAFLFDWRLFRSTFPLMAVFGFVASLCWVLLLPSFTREPAPHRNGK